MYTDPNLNTHLHWMKIWVESHQPGCNSGCDPNETKMFETKMLGPNPDLAQTPSIFIKSKYEIQRLVVYDLQWYNV